MAVVKRGKMYQILFRPFGGKLVGVKTFTSSKTEAKTIERAVLMACRSGD
ncbi:hypothetical protein ACFL2Q_00585 [Thermodesulfobacteriota bacterium]